MLLKASELLAEFIKAEKQKLDGIAMPHMPTLGSAYEEITKHGIYQDYAIPKSLDLRVVSGFIVVGGEMLAEQIDCMLVHGEGARIGLTQQYKYDISRVLCIFEVKKTLRKSDYVDAFEHLAKVRSKFADDFERRLEGGYRPDISQARRRFSKLTGKVAPENYLDMNHLSKTDGMLFYTLVQESLAPITIIHGYEGYKTEAGLRTAFVDILEEAWESGNRTGWGIPSIPSLVTSNNFCLVKGSGIPFIVMMEKYEWVSVFSTRHNSAKLILELIWHKIGDYFNVKMPWDDGLHMDSVRPLLVAEARESGDAAGWAYRPIDLKEKHMIRGDDNLWSPSAIGKAEIAALNILAMQGGYLSLDDGMNDYLVRNHDTPLEQVVEALLLTRQFMRGSGCIRPIHARTLVITNDDGTGYVASEIERFDLWCAANEIDPHYMSIHFTDE